MRKLMVIFVERDDYGSHININHNISNIKSFREINTYAGDIGFLVLKDLLHGENGPANPKLATELAQKIERKAPFFSIFNSKVRLIECYNFGALLVMGRTPGGIPVVRDAPTGIRLLRYAADHGVPEARDFLVRSRLE